MASLEFSVLVLTIMASLMLVSFVGRVSEVSGSIFDVASEAAREASLHRSSDSAEAAVLKSSESTLMEMCESHEVTVHTQEFKPGGYVEVDIQCEISLLGLSLLSIPGRMTFRANASEIIDRYRAGSVL